MKYEGPLYGKIGSRYIPLRQTSNDIEKLEKEAVDVEYLVRNWVNDSTKLANMPLREMVLYALREENAAKIEALGKMESAEQRTQLLLGVHGDYEPWNEPPAMVAKIKADAKALALNPESFCQIIAKELVKIVQAKLSHF